MKWQKEMALRPNYLDASILVKLLLDEEKSSIVRSYLIEPDQSWKICTSFCFVEALGVLKRKYLSKKELLSELAYRASVRRMKNWLRDNYIEIHQEDFIEFDVFSEADAIVEGHNIDFVDALQIVTVERSWPILAQNSRPIILTADTSLARIARERGLPTWNCMDTDRPSD